MKYIKQKRRFQELPLRKKIKQCIKANEQRIFINFSSKNQCKLNLKGFKGFKIFPTVFYARLKKGKTLNELRILNNVISGFSGIDQNVIAFIPLVDYVQIKGYQEFYFELTTTIQWNFNELTKQITFSLPEKQNLQEGQYINGSIMIEFY